MVSNQFCGFISEDRTSQNDSNNSASSSHFFYLLFFLYFTLFNKILKLFLSFFILCQLRCANSKVKVSKSEFSRQEDESCYCMRFERDEVEMVMAKLGLFCSSESEELEENYGSKELSELFELNEPSLGEVKQAFDVFDENKDGFIDARELKRVLCVLGLKEAAELENCHRIIRSFDENQDGRIDFNEFVKIIDNSLS